MSQVVARSSTGGRATNQDRVVAMPDLVVLADGMGGHEGGEFAAHAAVAAATGALIPPVTVNAVEAAFRDAEAAVQQVRHRELNRPGFDGDSVQWVPTGWLVSSW